jgi:SAM-dependent methyltransferase
MAALRLKSVYEVGVGEGTPLVTMAKMGLRVAGCDISEAMVKKAKDNFSNHGLSPDPIQWGDIQDATTIANQLDGGVFDAVIAVGVLPHVANDRLALANMDMLIRDGGKLFVEFRNKLFSLFTFNQHTRNFILHDLLRDVSWNIKDIVGKELSKHIDTSHDGSTPGFDKILAKLHNPFELTELVESCGYRDVRIHWYHYHPAPPMLEDKIVGFREVAMALEHEGSWRGYFLCSAGVIEATKHE